MQWLLGKVEAGAGSVGVGAHLHNIYQWSERRKEYEITVVSRKYAPPLFFFATLALVQNAGGAYYYYYY